MMSDFCQTIVRQLNKIVGRPKNITEVSSRAALIRILLAASLCGLGEHCADRRLFPARSTQDGLSLLPLQRLPPGGGDLPAEARSEDAEAVGRVAREGRFIGGDDDPTEGQSRHGDASFLMLLAAASKTKGFLL